MFDRKTCTRFLAARTVGLSFHPPCFSCLLSTPEALTLSLSLPLSVMLISSVSRFLHYFFWSLSHSVVLLPLFLTPLSPHFCAVSATLSTCICCPPPLCPPLQLSSCLTPLRHCHVFIFISVFFKLTENFKHRSRHNVLMSPVYLSPTFNYKRCAKLSSSSLPQLFFGFIVKQIPDMLFQL